MNLLYILLFTLYLLIFSANFLDSLRN